MYTTTRLSTPSVLSWWIEVQPLLYTFSQLIEISPHTQVNNAVNIVCEARNLYETIQEIHCPSEADTVYEYFTHALINLFLCYEAVALGQWDKAEAFLGRAITHWIYTKCACHSIGVSSVCWSPGSPSLH